MAYCNKCGSEISDNSLFCTQCGNKIENKLPDDNDSENVNNSFENNINQNNLGRANYNFKPAIDVLSKSLLKPFSAISEFTFKGNRESTIFLTIMLTFANGFLAIWRVQQVYSNFQSSFVHCIQRILTYLQTYMPQIFDSMSQEAMNDIMSFVNNDMMTFINEFKLYINIPYEKIFIHMCILFLIAVIFIFALTFLIVNVFLHKQNKAFELYKTSIAVFTPLLYFNIVSILLGYLSFKISIIVFIMALTLFVLLWNTAMNDIYSISKDKGIVITSISYVVFMLCIFLCLVAFGKSSMMVMIDNFKNMMNMYK